MITGGLKSKGGINRTICQIHREIYQEIVKPSIDRDYVVILLEQAFECGKKMGNKLRMYKDNLSQYWYNDHRLDGGAIDEQ